MPEHPEVPTSIPIEPAYMAQIEQLTAEGREVLCTVAEFSARVGPIIEHMDELRHSVGFDGDAATAIAATTGWDKLMDIMLAIVNHAEAGADEVPETRRHGTPGFSTSVGRVGKGWRDGHDTRLAESRRHRLCGRTAHHRRSHQ